MKIYGILYIAIIFAFDTGDCKCDEYIIVLKEVSCAGTHSLHTTKLIDIKWNELTYPYNSTGMYHEINGYKGCVLELECENQSSECNKRKNDRVKPIITKKYEIKTENKPIYDINIIYLNKNSSPKDTNPHTITVSYCEYAETACVNKNKASSSIINKKDTITRTMKELMITLKRDQTSKIQPIFTGFVSRNVTGDTKYEYLEATVSCKYKENSNCEINSEIHDKSGSSSIKEILDEPGNRINVYMHSEYIQNNTKIKYSGCTKNSNDTDDLLNIQCDAENFTYDNSLVLYTPNTDSTTSKQNESINVHCHIRKSITIKAKLQKENIQNGFNIINFTSCHSNINNSDLTEHQKRNITIILENKNEYIDSTTKKDNAEINLTNLSNKITTSTTDRLPSPPIGKPSITATKEHILKMHLTTDSSNNCNQYPLPNISEGKVIEFQTNDIKKEFPKYGSVDLKLLSCINFTSFPDSKTNEHKKRETKLIIVLNNNGSYSKQLSEELDDLEDSTVILLQCNHTDTKKDKIAFKCDTMNLSDYLANETNNDSTRKDKVSLAIENPDSEMIILIVIASIASFSMALVCAIKKCSNVGEYIPAATRERPDVEDTPF